MNDSEIISDTLNSAAYVPSCLDINVTTVFLGMSIVNEAKRQLKKPLQRANLTMNQWLVLKILFLKRADTATKISSTMNSDAASTTRSLDGLEIRGLVERMRKTSDRRVIRLKVTSKGINIAEQIYASYSKILKNFDNRLMHDELTMWKIIERCIANYINDSQN